MKCTNCKIRKLSSEFWLEPLHEGCSKVPSICLRCLEEHLAESGDCLICGESLDDSELRQMLSERMRTAFKLEHGIDPVSEKVEEEGEEEEDEIDENSSEEKVLIVRNANAEGFEVKFTDKTTIFAIRKLIGSKVDFDHEQISLKRPNRQEIRTFGSERRTQARDFNLRNREVVYWTCQRMRFEEGNEYRNIALDTHWKNPTSDTRDFLDGSCVGYCSRDERICFEVNYNNKEQCGVSLVEQAASISGGRQRIALDLSVIPDEVDLLFIVISGYGKLSSFVNPTIRLRNLDRNEECLLKYTVAKVMHLQAFIVGCICRSEDRGWTVNDIGVDSDGSIDNMAPIRRTIRRVAEGV